LALWIAGGVFAQRHQSPREDEFYPITPIPMPEGEVIEPGAIELLPGGKLAVGTRRGDVWHVEGAEKTPPQPKWALFARGFHEILGLAERDGWLYVTHRPEVCRIKDSDGDGRADVVETVCDKWGISGDYHEYTFGSRFDRDGNLWAVLCLTGSFTSNVPFRGWVVRTTPGGELIPTCSGIRSPGGIGENALGDMFATDNQGPWNGSSNLKWLKPRGFLGHPDGNRWYNIAPEMGPKPVAPNSKSRWAVERERIPQLVPPACFLVHGRLGQSSSGIACDTTGGKFGPFQNQLFVGDQCYSNVCRVFLEKVNGVYQGAAFPFRWNFQSGCVPLRMAPDGSLYYGGTARGWGSRGGRDFSFERVNWTGRVPFEIHEMRALPDGFEFTFTTPADRATLADPKSWKAHAFTYIYQADYGSPEVDEFGPTVTAIEASSDGLSARVHVDKLTKGHVHQFVLDGVRDSNGQPLVHDVAYYTLNEIPGR
jgi:hypothetical protein